MANPEEGLLTVPWAIAGGDRPSDGEPDSRYRSNDRASPGGRLVLDQATCVPRCQQMTDARPEESLLQAGVSVTAIKSQFRAMVHQAASERDRYPAEILELNEIRRFEQIRSLIPSKMSCFGPYAITLAGDSPDFAAKRRNSDIGRRQQKQDQCAIGFMDGT